MALTDLLLSTHSVMAARSYSKHASKKRQKINKPTNEMCISLLMRIKIKWLSTTLCRCIWKTWDRLHRQVNDSINIGFAFDRLPFIIVINLHSLIQRSRTMFFVKNLRWLKTTSKMPYDKFVSMFSKSPFPT